MTMTQDAITVRGLEKSYKNVQVLRGISFNVPKGTVFALLGPNGAGKTTAIKILTTLLTPDGGTASLCGYDVLKQPAQVRREISLTGQFAAVDGALTGRENLRMIGKLRHLKDAGKKAEELLARFELSGAADRRVSSYSGGMRRRLDLAMSLVGAPAVLFLDEPTTGLDPQSRLNMWKIIKELTRAGTTVFLTTQYLDEAEQLADQLAILNKGEIVAAGTPAELKKLLPPGHIELKILEERHLLEARALLQEFKLHFDEGNQVLSVETDGSIAHLTDILNRLKNAGVSVSELTQKQPTLEDVFLMIVGGPPEKGAERHVNF
ncbi:ABC-2 type transport system ATP-binding protein [Sporobacter termitidis DSM 10068]|uniref:ABC-2 type transport system ATP-binding protein n=2 Tax=Sporobacter TaxID=44748 RepID=A0A1M5YGD5_9FIRM|nr:ABC-2 type transport system ATP-binding protein [Sporobacter termitidis DSM 10068]